MATTSPDNLKTPDAGDQYALVQDLGALADTTQAALTRRANSFVGTSAQRLAYASPSPGAKWQDTNGSRLEYVWWGQWETGDTGWVTIPYSSGFKAGTSSGSSVLEYRVLNGEMTVRGGGTNTASALAPGTEYIFGQIPSALSPPITTYGGGVGSGGRDVTPGVTSTGNVFFYTSNSMSGNSSWAAGTVTYPV